MGDEKPRFNVSSRPYPSGTASIVDLAILAIVGFFFFAFVSIASALIALTVALFIVLALSLRIVNEWNRLAVLRFGKYVGIIGPGLYLIVPIVDATPVTVDLRVISTPFAAEKTLTKDNVPVDVDAILFWQVTDPEKAILNVQSYHDSVLLASQTAMRDIIGKSQLSEMLSGRDIIGQDIQELIEERVENWGIKAISVEIRDVTIPTDLQNAMARVATSDREKQSRVILAESESLAADKMLEAAKKYEQDPYAMQLRSLNMMYEMSLTGRNMMVFIPTENKGFSIPVPFGVTGLQDFFKKQQGKGKQQKEDSK